MRDVNYLYDKPIITVRGTEKIHGTNAAVCFSEEMGFWVQSRNNIITPEKDHFACAFHAYNNRDVWGEIINSLAESYNIDLRENILSIYFEWCGGSIQKKSALSGLDKRAIIFEYFRVTPKNDLEIGEWLPTNFIDSPDHMIYNIGNFPTYDIQIDFSNPLLSQNKMIENVIEPNSPVGQHFGIQGNIGEGIVFSFKLEDRLFSFKVKGQKHSVSKVKTLKPVSNLSRILPKWCALHGDLSRCLGMRMVIIHQISGILGYS